MSAQVALALLLAAYAIQRLGELALSARNARALAARGAIEHGRGLFPWFVAAHLLFPALLAAEVLALGVTSGPAWPLWLALLAAAQALRASAMRALGPLWTARVWVLPDHPLVRAGPYRWLRHPSYVAVTLELLAAPLVLGAWRTAIVIGALHLPLVLARIAVEARALRPRRDGRAAASR